MTASVNTHTMTNTDESKSAPLCRYWMETGWCSYGEHCGFSHPQFNHIPDGCYQEPTSPVSPPISNSLSDHSNHAPSSSNGSDRQHIQFRYWAKFGNCNRGKKCRFQHGPLEQEQVSYMDVFDFIHQQHSQHEMSMSPMSTTELLVNAFILTPPPMMREPYQTSQPMETIATILCPNALWRESREMNEMPLQEFLHEEGYEIIKETQSMEEQDLLTPILDRMIIMNPGKYEYKCSQWDDHSSCCKLENRCEEHIAYKQWLKKKIFGDGTQSLPLSKGIRSKKVDWCDARRSERW